MSERDYKVLSLFCLEKYLSKYNQLLQTNTTIYQWMTFQKMNWTKYDTLNFENNYVIVFVISTFVIGFALKRK